VYFDHIIFYFHGHIQSRGTNTQIISIFSAEGAFSHKFSIAPSETKLLIESKKSLRVQKRDGLPLSPCHVWWGSWVARRLHVDKKVMFFFVCLSVYFLWRFGMTKFVITETLWSSIIFKTIMVSSHRWRFVVVHLCSRFPIDSHNFSRGAKFYQKYHFWP